MEYVQKLLALWRWVIEMSKFGCCFTWSGVEVDGFRNIPNSDKHHKYVWNLFLAVSSISDFFSPETEVIAIILNNDIFFKVRSLQKECRTSWSLQPIQTWRNIVFQQTAHTAVTFDSFKRFRCQFCFEGSLMCSLRLLLRLRYFKINFLYVIDNSFLCRCFSSTRTRKKS